MITLKNITTLNTIIEINKFNKINNINNYDQKILKIHKIEDFNDLENLMNDYSMRKNMHSSDELFKILYRANRNLYKLDNKTPEIYQCKSYIDQFPILDCKKIDTSVFAYDLLYASPIINKKNNNNLNTKRLLDVNVYQLKQLISHCNTECNNAFLDFINVDKIENEKKIMQIIKYALHIYEKQLLSQYNECKEQLYMDRQDKLFYLNKKEKLMLLQEQYTEIIEYLLQFDNYRWNLEPNEEEKYLMYKSTLKHDFNSALLRRRFLDIISNYISLEDSKKGVVKSKSLDKFIKY